MTNLKIIVIKHGSFNLWLYLKKIFIPGKEDYSLYITIKWTLKENRINVWPLRLCENNSWGYWIGVWDRVALTEGGGYSEDSSDVQVTQIFNVSFLIAVLEIHKTIQAELSSAAHLPSILGGWIRNNI